MGNFRIRFPVTANTALAIAGAAQGTPFSDAARLLVVVDQMVFNLRTFIHSHHRERIEFRLLQPPLLESKLLEERRRCTEIARPPSAPQ